MKRVLVTRAQNWCMYRQMNALVAAVVHRSHAGMFRAQCALFNDSRVECQAHKAGLSAHDRTSHSNNTSKNTYVLDFGDTPVALLEFQAHIHSLYEYGSNRKLNDEFTGVEVVLSMYIQGLWCW